jgi:hypothetical protein
MIKFFNNRQAFLLISSYLVIICLSILAASFFLRTTDDNFNVRRNMNMLEAKNAADEGLEYAYEEIRSATQQPWVTHTVTDPQNGNYQLNPVTSAPDITLSEHCYIDPTTGNYVHNTGKFEVKVFISPNSSPDLIILSRGYSNDGTTSRLFLSRINPENIYSYFLFTPESYDFTSKTWDAAGGKMYIGKRAVFHDGVRIDNISELSALSGVSYAINSWLPMGVDIDEVIPEDLKGRTWRQYYYNIHNPWVTPNSDPRTGESFDEPGNPNKPYAYWNNPYGRLCGDKPGLYEDRNTPWDPNGYYGDPSDILPDVHPEYYQDTNLLTHINDVVIPNRLAVEYPYNRNWLPTQDWGMQYEDIVSVGYLNTSYQEQSQVLQSILTGTGAEGVIKDQYTSTPAKLIGPLNVSPQDYKNDAQANGIYIYRACSNPNPELCSPGDPVFTYLKVNGETYKANDQGEIWIKGTKIAEDKSFINTYSMQENEVTVVYLDAIMQTRHSPNNGIIYSENALVVDNAQTIPRTGLTWVSPKNFLLKGDYNNPPDPNDWHPSAVICAGDVYTLSDNFNFPQELPVTRHTTEYPYEDDFVRGEYNWLANVKNVGGKPTSIYLGQMVNNVDKDYTYNISLIGPRAYEPKVLENWEYYQDVGDLDRPPSNYTQHMRKITGSMIRLADDDFPATGTLDDEVPRPDRKNPGWPENMAAIGPQDNAHNLFAYESRYDPADPTTLPPGDYMSFTEGIYTEIANTDYNFNNYLPEFY